MNLLKAASTVSLLTLLSRVTGLVREMLIASAFGAGAATDAFNVAFRIPNLFRRLFGEGAFSQAFVPLLAATRAKHGDAVTHDLVNAVATVLAWVLLATCVVGVAGAPVLVWLMGSGLQQFDEAVVLTPPIKMSLEKALAYVGEDELVEITPKSIRLRKIYLDPNERKRMSRSKEADAVA